MKLQSSIFQKENENSHLDLIRMQHKNEMLQICKLLEWSEYQYCEHQFEVYNSVLKRRFSCSPPGMLEEVAYNPLMRGFFNNEWSKRNQVNFLPFVEDYFLLSQGYVCDDGSLHLEWNYEHEIAYLIEEYLYCHSHYVLINDKDFLNSLNYTLNIILKK